MEMTNEEIIKSYKEAKNKQKQIKILADLNGCRPMEIKKIVGVEEPKKEEKKIEAVEEMEAKTVEGIPGLMILPASVMEDYEPKALPRVEPPESIIRLATKRLEELEETIKAAELEYKEIASFLEMGA